MEGWDGEKAGKKVKRHEQSRRDFKRVLREGDYETWEGNRREGKKEELKEGSGNGGGKEVIKGKRR